jgi:type I restriction enzyme S subunit
MSAYKPYPKYKPSGVEWLGEVPEGWKVTKLKFTSAITPSNIDKKSYEDELPISLCNYTDVYYNETITPEIEFMAATATREQIRKFSLKKHDVIITKDSEDPNDIAVPSLVAETMDSVVCGYHLTLLRPAKNTNGRFLKRYFDSKTTRSYFSTRANGLTRYGLGSYPLSNADIALPPLSEQHQIAAFLDRECGKLDALQAKQKRLIELLKEKRQSLISHAVTHGLDPTAKLKPSGIEWLGEVPEHWIPSKVKWVSLKVKTGGTPSDPCWFTEEPEVPWLTPGDFSDESFRMTARRFVSRDAIAKREAPSFPPSSIFVVGIGATLGKVARLAQRQPASSNQQINAIVPSSKIESDYLLASLVAQTEQMKNCASASTLDIMNQEKTKSLHIALPPLAEQRAIVAHLDEKCGKIDKLKAKAERGIELLKERRSALISAAVTGKIDVREN